MSAKDPFFMETGISKFIFYEGLCHSVQVMLKMRNDNRLNEIKYDTMDNFFQLTKLSLDSLTDFNSFNFYNFDSYTHDITKTYATELKNEIIEDKQTLEQELRKFGRFFILENFMDPEEKNNWIELVIQLIEINPEVREDIRDYLLKDPSNIKKMNDILNDSISNSNNTSNNVSNMQSAEQTKRHNPGKKHHGKSIGNKTHRKEIGNSARRKSTNKINFSKELNIQIENEDNLFKSIDVRRLKPPFVWNFPVWRIKLIKKQRNLTSVNNNEINTKIPDFKRLYVDGRIEKFLELFEIIFENNIKYCKEKLNNNWEYMLYKQYQIFGIEYKPFKEKFFRKINLVPPKPKTQFDEEIEEPKNNEDEIEEDIQIDDNLN